VPVPTCKCRWTVCCASRHDEEEKCRFVHRKNGILGGDARSEGLAKDVLKRTEWDVGRIAATSTLRSLESDQRTFPGFPQHGSFSCTSYNLKNFVFQKDDDL
jgi:hypothetical protein